VTTNFYLAEIANIDLNKNISSSRNLQTIHFSPRDFFGKSAPSARETNKKATKIAHTYLAPCRWRENFITYLCYPRFCAAQIYFNFPLHRMHLHKKKINTPRKHTPHKNRPEKTPALPKTRKSKPGEMIRAWSSRAGINLHVRRVSGKQQFTPSWAHKRWDRLLWNDCEHGQKPHKALGAINTRPPRSPNKAQDNNNASCV